MAVELGYRNVFRYPQGYPEWHAKALPVESAPAGLSPTAFAPEEGRPLHGWAMIWTILGLFFGGVALNLTPCVYPLLPITVSYFGGRSGQGEGKLLFHGALYVAGLAFTNSVLGVFAALTGGLMGAMLQHPLVLGLVAAILVSLAGSLFGFWELRLPSGLTRAASRTYKGYFGTLFMGLTLGIVAAPCIGPFVLGLLTWVASMGSPWLGFIVFFTLSLGLGLPLFLLAMFSGKIDRLPRSGEWMLWVRKLMGWTLVGMAAYYLRPLLPKTAGTFFFAGVLLAAGLHLGWFERTRAGFNAFMWLRKGAGIAGIVLSTLLIATWVMRGPGMAWKPYSDELLAEARRLKKPVIIDFYADWCAPCRDLEEIAFHDPNVAKLAKGEFIMIKVDLTRKGNPADEDLLRQYGVKGVPTVVFLDRKGKEQQELRIVDFLPAEQLLVQMERSSKR